MKVMKGQSTKRAEVPHPKQKSGEALRSGIKALRSQMTDDKRTMPERPAHRREG